MIILKDGTKVDEKLIRFYFEEYFTNKGISIIGLDYRILNTNLFESAFLYCYDNLFKPIFINYNNPYDCNRTNIDISNFNNLIIIYDVLIRLCKEFNIIGYLSMYSSLTGITEDTIKNWYRGNLEREYSNPNYTLLAQMLMTNAKNTARNKLSDSQLGLITEANNDAELGMQYNAKRLAEQAVISANLNANSLPQLENL